MLQNKTREEGECKEGDEIRLAKSWLLLKLRCSGHLRVHYTIISVFVAVWNFNKIKINTKKLV